MRGATKGAIVFDYRGAVPDSGASTVLRLGEMPIGARDLLLARFASDPPAGAGTPPPALNSTLLLRHG